MRLAKAGEDPDIVSAEKKSHRGCKRCAEGYIRKSRCNCPKRAAPRDCLHRKPCGRPPVRDVGKVQLALGEHFLKQYGVIDTGHHRLQIKVESERERKSDKSA